MNPDPFRFSANFDLGVLVGVFTSGHTHTHTQKSSKRVVPQTGVKKKMSVLTEK